MVVGTPSASGPGLAGLGGAIPRAPPPASDTDRSTIGGLDQDVWIGMLTADVVDHTAGPITPYTVHDRLLMKRNVHGHLAIPK